jgi:pimeloyl-ACP methyl ester carboxylesterase
MTQSHRHSVPKKMPPQHRLRQPPGPLLMLMEGRAPWEFAALQMGRLLEDRVFSHLPEGDGHPVVVLPGLAANDLTTLPLRSFLRRRGYVPYPWSQGFNFGPRMGVLSKCLEQVQAVVAAHGQKASLIGWSLGGLFARELAKEVPELVRCVITLGTPFTGHPEATNAWRLFELVSGQSVHDEETLAGIRRPPPVPTTSLYSRSDGIVAWHCSLNEPAPHTENIEVHASHIGMGMNPLAMYVIADRLAQDPAAWQAFDLRGARRWLYKVTHPVGHESPAGQDD